MPAARLGPDQGAVAFSTGALRALQRVEVCHFPGQFLKQTGRAAIGRVELDDVAAAGAGADAGAGRPLIGAKERKE